MSNLSTSRRALRALILIASIAIVLIGINLLEAQTNLKPASAADLSQFNPGNIIDDNVFFNGNALSDGDIQNFLNSKVSSCRSGYTCLKDYAQDTSSIASNPMCGQYQGAANESAAVIIGKVSRACGISPKAILVTLQKEQGLVTDTWPTTRQYNAAMGALCPDTSPCDSAAAGFFKQVYTGAYLFKRYTQPSGTGAGTEYSSRFDLMYPVGQTSSILYNPNADCGRQSVQIQNQATHVLYVYTPYTPNAAALNAGYSVGDSCSAYGNRNFYNYFVDWFGTVRGEFTVSGAVAIKYSAVGGPNGFLGTPISPNVCGLVRGGCYQEFRGGYIITSPTQQTYALSNAISRGWDGHENGVLGYPNGDTVCGARAGGCYQVFEGGYVFVNPRGGSFAVPTEFRQAWNRYGNENGFMGYPVGGVVCGALNGGCYQQFDSGYLFKNPQMNMVFVVSPEVRASWPGFEGGYLGYPSGDAVCGAINGGCYQQFDGGYIFKNPATGNLYPVSTAVRAGWVGYENGTLGYPTSATVFGLIASGSYQWFQGGLVFTSPSTGSHAVLPAVRGLWNTFGNENGPLGYPTSDPTSFTSNSYSQSFQGGVIRVTNGVAYIQSATDAFFNILINNTWLGTATGQKICGLVNGGCYQWHQGGLIFSSPTNGTHPIRPSVRSLWNKYGNENGPLGYPTSDPNSADENNFVQTFQGGVIEVRNGIALIQSTSDAFFSVQINNTWLGSATGQKVCGLVGNGCYQWYQGGLVFSSPASGTHPVRMNARQLWNSLGNENGPLGYPTSDPSSPDENNYTQTYSGGTIRVVGGIAVRQ